MVGRKLGSYTIERELGRGGMGTVYAATHELLGRRAAVKVLQPQASHDKDAVQRFFNEARAASAIKHAGIVEIYDLGLADDGVAYLAMELLEGETLAARIRRRGPLGERAALAIAAQIVAALVAAHRAGIVHRDLKPDNVFLVGERVVLLDFGIAKLLGDDRPEAIGLTATGAVMGTPLYMSPEQCRGAEQVDARADLYGLGCILFELLCGRAPFVGPGTGDVIAAHIHVAPPSPRSLAPAISAELEALVLKLLAKAPKDRPASAEAVARTIEALRGGTALAETIATGPQVDALGATVASGPQVPLSRARRWGVMIAAGGVVAALATVAIVWALGADPARPPIDAAPVAVTPPAPDAGLSLTTDRVYLELGGLTGDTGVAKKLIPTLRQAIVDHLAGDPGFLTSWPGGGAPTAEALADAGVLGAGLDATLTLVTLRDPAQPGTECTLKFTVWGYPDKAIFAFSTANVSVQLPDLSDAELERGAIECVRALAATLLQDKVIPMLRQRALAEGHADEVMVLLAKARASVSDAYLTARRARAVLAIDSHNLEAVQLLDRAVEALVREARDAHAAGDTAAYQRAYEAIPDGRPEKLALDALLKRQ